MENGTLLQRTRRSTGVTTHSTRVPPLDVYQNCGIFDQAVSRYPVGHTIRVFTKSHLGTMFSSMSYIAWMGSVWTIMCTEGGGSHTHVTKKCKFSSRLPTAACIHCTKNLYSTNVISRLWAHVKSPLKTLENCIGMMLNPFKRKRWRFR